MDNQEEIWKQVVGYESLYEISSLGRLKSLFQKTKAREKILKPGVNGHGYLQLVLAKTAREETIGYTPLLLWRFWGTSQMAQQRFA